MGLISSLRRRIDVRVIPKSESWQLQERETLSKLFKWGAVDCVFDVGANEGQYGIMLRKHVGYRGLIISFEPDTKAANVLRKRAHGDPLWHVEEIALSDVPGEGLFNVTGGSQFGSLEAPNPHAAGDFGGKLSIVEKRRVRLETLSTAYLRHERQFGFKCPFLKMDTQGHDGAVIRGGAEVISHFVGLQSEMAVIPIYEGAPTYQRAIRDYEEAGFTLTAIVPNNAGHFPRLIEFDCIMVRKDLVESRPSTIQSDIR